MGVLVAVVAGLGAGLGARGWMSEASVLVHPLEGLEGLGVMSTQWRLGPS